jgi:hypothetical protein
MNRLADHHRQYSAVLLIVSASKKRSLTSGLIYLIKISSNLLPRVARKRDKSDSCWINELGMR